MAAAVPLRESGCERLDFQLELLFGQQPVLLVFAVRAALLLPEDISTGRDEIAGDFSGRDRRSRGGFLGRNGHRFFARADRGIFGFFGFGDFGGFGRFGR